MPRRTNSLGRLTSGVACVLFAIVASGSNSPANADCITQPDQQAPDGAHWSLHLDHAKNRRCWILVDAAGHEISQPPPEQQDEAPVVSSVQSFFEKITATFTGGSQPPPPPETPAASPAAPHRPHSRLATSNTSEQKGESNASKHEMTDAERNALFAEFERWRESHQMTGGDKAPAQ